MFSFTAPKAASPAPATTPTPTAAAPACPPAQGEAAAAALSLVAAEAAPTPEAGAGPLDFAEIEREWWEGGALSEDTYRRLATFGLPRRVVDAYIDGQIALGRALRAELLEPIGGEEGFREMAAWAREALDPRDLAAYEAALRGAPEAARLALRGVHAAYVEATGRRPTLVGGASAGPDDSLFHSAEQVAAAMRDPRYKSDPAYRAEVAGRLARSNVFGRKR